MRCAGLEELTAKYGIDNLEILCYGNSCGKIRVTVRSGDEQVVNELAPHQTHSLVVHGELISLVYDCNATNYSNCRLVFELAAAPC
jgi:hypothetical protein